MAENRYLLVQGELSGEIHRIGIVESEEFLPEGSRIKARVPVPLAMRLALYGCALGSAETELSTCC